MVGLSADNYSKVLIPPPQTGASEDCLFLDVVVPKTIYDKAKKVRKNNKKKGIPKDKGAAVLVWIYGGGYVFGGKNYWGNPTGLLARSQENGDEGIVFVTINYRLGLFGWLSGSEELTPNAGLLDQRLALDWVQKNIHLFGGNPSRVTLMGESAGGGSIFHQMTAYGDKKELPFQQVIPQSPAYQPSPPKATKNLNRVLDIASQLLKEDVTSVEDLRKLPFQTLYNTNALVVGTAPYSEFIFSPTIDGTFVPDLPSRLLSHEKQNNSLKALVGHNAREGISFAPPSVQTEARFASYVQRLLPGANSSIVNHITEVLYPPVFNGSYGYTDAIGRSAALAAEYMITCNAASIASAYPNSYAYQFSVPPALHAGDVAYTFFNGDTTTPDQGRPVDPETAKDFQRMLVNFVLRGNPNVSGLPAVDMYGVNETISNVNVTGFGEQIKDTAQSPRCKFWQEAPWIPTPST